MIFPMSGTRRHGGIANGRQRAWEPEPLHIPLEREQPQTSDRRERRDDDDRPGTHVVTIDLA